MTEEDGVFAVGIKNPKDLGDGKVQLEMHCLISQQEAIVRAWRLMVVFDFVTGEVHTFEVEPMDEEQERLVGHALDEVGKSVGEQFGYKKSPRFSRN